MKKQRFLLLGSLAILIGGCGLSGQAKEVAAKAIDKKVKRCGSSYFLKRRKALTEMKDFNWSMKSIPLSEADHLNGLEFSGEVEFNFSASRTAYEFDRNCWFNWEKYASLGLYNDLTVRVRKRNGNWEVDSNEDPNAVFNCSDLPKIPVCYP